MKRKDKHGMALHGYVFAAISSSMLTDVQVVIGSVMPLRCRQVIVGNKKPPPHSLVHAVPLVMESTGRVDMSTTITALAFERVHAPWAQGTVAIGAAAAGMGQYCNGSVTPAGRGRNAN